MPHGPPPLSPHTVHPAHTTPQPPGTTHPHARTHHHQLAHHPSCQSRIAGEGGARRLRMLLRRLLQRAVRLATPTRLLKRRVDAQAPWGGSDRGSGVEEGRWRGQASVGWEGEVVGVTSDSAIRRSAGLASAPGARLGKRATRHSAWVPVSDAVRVGTVGGGRGGAGVATRTDTAASGRRMERGDVPRRLLMGPPGGMWAGWPRYLHGS